MDTQGSNPSLSATRRESGMVQRLRASLHRNWHGERPPHILVGCSGGKDSVVLAVLLQALVRTRVIQASLVHVDHRVRDDSADAAQLVEELGQQLDIQVHTVVLEEGIVARHSGAGAEEALRRERYRAFADVATDTGAVAVALAHHQQDQAETVLLHLIRGAGLQGASGMREWSEIQVPWWDVGASSSSLRLWRPLLGEPVSTIDAFHRENALPVAEDRTNEDRMYRRNAVRHDVLPELEAIFPGAVANLARFADLASADDRMLEELARNQFSVRPGGGLHRSVLVEADPAIQRRIVRQWILDAGFEGDLTSDRIDAVCWLATRNRSGSLVEIGSDWSVTIDGGVLFLRT